MAASFYSSVEGLGTENVHVTAIRLLFNSPVNQGKTIVVVEGPDDKDFYAKFLDATHAELYADGNCDKHQLILNELNAQYRNRLMAIKDADFDHLNKQAPSVPNLFLTDEHDMEGMILKNGIPQKIYECYPGRCNTISIDEICENLKVVSYLRWMNNVQELGLNFKLQKWSSHYKHPYEVDIACYLAAVISDSKDCQVITINELHRFMEERGEQDIRQLTRGHDLMECLYIRAKAMNAKNFSKAKFFKDIREAYTKDMFAKTQLCKQIYDNNKVLLSNPPCFSSDAIHILGG